MYYIYINHSCFGGLMVLIIAPLHFFCDLKAQRLGPCLHSDALHAAQPSPTTIGVSTV